MGRPIGGLCDFPGQTMSSISIFLLIHWPTLHYLFILNKKKIPLAPNQN
jgi:hypothetical protein